MGNGIPRVMTPADYNIVMPAPSRKPKLTLIFGVGYLDDRTTASPELAACAFSSRLPPGSSLSRQNAGSAVIVKRHPGWRSHSPLSYNLHCLNKKIEPDSS